MLRLLLLPLFLFTLSMACMGQTFQYSRGWTNGKRAPVVPIAPIAAAAPVSSGGGHSLGLYDLFELPESPNDRRLERCLVHLQHFVGNSMLHRYADDLNIRSRASGNVNINPNQNPGNNLHNDNTLFGNVNHHQSNELYDALNAAVAASSPGSDAVDPIDYGKH